MVERPERALLDLDLDKPSASRIYDYFLGGSHNFEVDRTIAREVIALRPDVPLLARNNRAFLRRCVQFMVHHGVTQFIDIGSGIPTAGNVHEVARLADPESRVVYVDCDPVAVTHSRLILRGDERTAIVQADLRDIDRIFRSPEVDALIDLSRPVGVLMFAILHFIPDGDDPAGLIAAVGDRVISGSYLALSHATTDPDTTRAARIEGLYRSTPMQSTLRTPEEITALFGRFELIPPGLVELSRWRPDNHDAPAPPDAESACAGVARLP